jgi:uncharacterized repeat protein (TIGR03847 family)
LAVGTVGEPGNRTFYLQVRSPHLESCIILEKIQLAAVAERLQILLKELRRGRLIENEIWNQSVPDFKPGLWSPIEPDFKVGVMALAWESEAGLIELQMQALSENEGEEEEIISLTDTTAPDLVSISFTIARARAFIQAANQVVNSGRAACPLCGQPADISGHLCPRANGYRR